MDFTRFKGMFSMYLSSMPNGPDGTYIQERANHFPATSTARDSQRPTQKNVCDGTSEKQTRRSRAENRTLQSTEGELFAIIFQKTKQQKVDFTRFELLTNLSSNHVVDSTPAYSRLHSFWYSIHQVEKWNRLSTKVELTASQVSKNVSGFR